MRWLDHREAVPDSLHGAIIALGNFDGFHKGHQAVERAFHELLLEATPKFGCGFKIRKPSPSSK